MRQGRRRVDHDWKDRPIAKGLDRDKAKGWGGPARLYSRAPIVYREEASTAPGIIVSKKRFMRSVRSGIEPAAGQAPMRVLKFL